MNQTEKTLKVGEKYLYKEDGGTERIKVLETKIYKDLLYVKFEILEIINTNTGLSMNKKNVGRTVEVSKLTDAYTRFALWEIHPL